MPDSSLILHVDMDSYFASVEVRENPHLRGLPVVVGSDPQEGRGRGVVSTCSYEARKFGIRSGMPISKAYRLCPTARFHPVNLALYCRTSEKIMAIIRQQSTHFEQVSIDEAFLRLDGYSDIDEAKAVAEKIQQEIGESEDLTCSIGIAPTRVVAKIASDHQKPNGITIVPQEDVEQFLFPLPVRKLPGIGKMTEKALSVLGISTIGQLAARDVQELSGVFGKSGVHLHSLAHGIDVLPPHSSSGPRSMSREITFDIDTADVVTLHETMDTLVDEVHHELVNEDLRFRTVSVKVRYTGFITHTKSRSVHRSSNDRMSIRKIAGSILHESLDGRRIRLIGVRLSGLSKRYKAERSLEDFLSPPHRLPEND